MAMDCSIIDRIVEEGKRRCVVSSGIPIVSKDTIVKYSGINLQNATQKVNGSSKEQIPLNSFNSHTSIGTSTPLHPQNRSKSIPIAGSSPSLKPEDLPDIKIVQSSNPNSLDSLEGLSMGSSDCLLYGTNDLDTLSNTLSGSQVRILNELVTTSIIRAQGSIIDAAKLLKADPLRLKRIIEKYGFNEFRSKEFRELFYCKKSVNDDFRQVTSVQGNGLENAPLNRQNKAKNHHKVKFTAKVILYGKEEIPADPKVVSSVQYGKLARMMIDAVENSHSLNTSVIAAYFKVPLKRFEFLAREYGFADEYRAATGRSLVFSSKK